MHKFGYRAIRLPTFQAATTSIIREDTSLRSAYIVYNLDKNQVALAQADYSPAQSNVEKISNSIPGASLSSTVSVTGNIPAPTNYPLPTFITGTYTQTLGASAAISGGASTGSGSAAPTGASRTNTATVSSSPAQETSNADPGSVLSSSISNMIVLTWSVISIVSSAGMVVLKSNRPLVVTISVQ
ncbi:hypothetical protein AMS68_007264 [Peltaster fructicola]|uniref:Uncharacterized protein n=1 Tax=Peltaster fructicola TaxID=286661 RepID=A0A6H0Y3Z9_9PEZI|nr:hypothetical protein AMS68_007264 [Peltaster fructicola]